MAKTRPIVKSSKGSEDTIDVRIAPGLKGWLRNYTQSKDSMSEWLVIERLLVYFNKLDETERDLILTWSPGTGQPGGLDLLWSHAGIRRGEPYSGPQKLDHSVSYP